MLAISADQVIDAWKSLQDGEWNAVAERRQLLRA
jgi:hypothetical protein